MYDELVGCKESETYKRKDVRTKLQYLDIGNIHATVIGSVIENKIRWKTVSSSGSMEMNDQMRTKK